MVGAPSLAEAWCWSGHTVPTHRTPEEDVMHPDIHAQAADLYRAEREREAREARRAGEAREGAGERPTRRSGKDGSAQRAEAAVGRHTTVRQVQDGGGAFHLQA